MDVRETMMIYIRSHLILIFLQISSIVKNLVLKKIRNMSIQLLITILSLMNSETDRSYTLHQFQTWQRLDNTVDNALIVQLKDKKLKIRRIQMIILRKDWSQGSLYILIVPLIRSMTCKVFQWTKTSFSFGILEKYGSFILKHRSLHLLGSILTKMNKKHT